MDWDLVIWLMLLTLVPFVWMVVIGSQTRLQSVDDVGFSVSSRLSGTHHLRWAQLHGTARKFESFNISAGRPRIEVAFRPESRFALRSRFAVRIDSTPQFVQFEAALAQHVPVITVRNLFDLFRRG